MPSRRRRGQRCAAGEGATQAADDVVDAEFEEVKDKDDKSLI